LVVIPAVFHFWQQQNPLPVRYESGTGTGWFSIRYSLGGPRLPNTSIVINVPVLQQGHFLSNVFVFAGSRSITYVITIIDTVHQKPVPTAVKF
jgi:hypothetical protein